MKKKQIKKLIITGLATDFCVNATVQDAFNLGYQLLIATDAHTTRTPGTKNVIKRYNDKWEQSGAELKKTNEIQF